MIPDTESGDEEDFKQEINKTSSSNPFLEIALVNAQKENKWINCGDSTLLFV